ncbi:MAG TPA: hypothetical protein PLU93_10030 [Treponemataceae bacterium]|nr:hypothetical protein [Treponemataceae bacterium]
MKKLWEILAVICIALAVTCCSSGSDSDMGDSPDGLDLGLSNQIRLNGVMTDISKVSVFQYFDGAAPCCYLTVDGTSEIVFNFFGVAHEDQIPIGTWRKIDLPGLLQISLDTQTISLLTETSVDIRISGTDGGPMTIKGTAKSEGIDFAIDYSGPYELVK